MTLGKSVRLNRIFSHASKRACSVAVDHFVFYLGRPLPELRDLSAVLEKLVAGKPDAVTMLKGAAKSFWPAHAGKAPLIVGNLTFSADDELIEPTASPEEVVRLGGDAIAVALGVRGPHELARLKILTDIVEEADKLELPVIAHIYSRNFTEQGIEFSHDPEEVFYAVRFGIECGADVIKAPFTGDEASFRDIVNVCPVPLVAAGGPKCETLQEGLEMASRIVASGARGATIGRNIWGTPDITRSLLAFKAVIHDNATPSEALAAAGFEVRGTD